MSPTCKNMFQQRETIYLHILKCYRCISLLSVSTCVAFMTVVSAACKLQYLPGNSTQAGTQFQMHSTTVKPAGLVFCFLDSLSPRIKPAAFHALVVTCVLGKSGLNEHDSGLMAVLTRPSQAISQDGKNTF